MLVSLFMYVYYCSYTRKYNNKMVKKITDIKLYLLFNSFIAEET